MSSTSGSSPVQSSHTQKRELDNDRIIAVIPALNEANNIATILSDTLIEVDYVIVVDDGSTDETAAKAQTFNNTTVLRNKRNLGKGASLTRGFIEALRHNPDILVTLDGDGQHDPKYIPKLIASMKQESADIVIGSRYKDESVSEAPRLRRFGLSIINRVNRSIVKSDLKDTSSGFRAYTKNSIQILIDVDSKGYGLEFEQLAKAESHGLNIVEVPIKVKYKGLSRTSKKNSFLLGANILSTLLKIAVERRPLMYFGVAGVIFFAIAAAVGSELLVLFNESRYFSIPLAVIALGFGLVGLLLILVSLVLHAMKRLRRTIQLSYRFRGQQEK
ncbi:MAG: glycosyltransferase family 2 protein [Nitrososphaeraceae archaeon]